MHPRAVMAGIVSHATISDRCKLLTRTHASAELSPAIVSLIPIQFTCRFRQPLFASRHPKAEGTGQRASAVYYEANTAWESADGSSSFSLRPDLKARWDDAGAAGKLRDYIGTIGFQYSF